MIAVHRNVHLTARDVTKSLEGGTELNLWEHDDPELTKKAAAIIEQLDGLDYATARYMLETIIANLKCTTIQADRVPV